MIRFIDITKDYFCFGESYDSSTFSPVCAFANTVTNQFIENAWQDRIFFNVEEISEIADPMGQRCLGLVPEGFFEVKSDYWKQQKWSN